MYLLYYYIFITRRVFHTYGVCLHLIYPIYLLLLYSYIYFFSLSYLYYIILFSISISFTRRCYTLRVGFTSYSLSISSHCLPYSFYTIPDLSVLPLWHTFLLLPVGVPHLRGFYTSLLISISSISYSLFSLCTIPYLSVLPLYTHSLSLSYIVYTYYIPPYYL